MTTADPPPDPATSTAPRSSATTLAEPATAPVDQAADRPLTREPAPAHPVATEPARTGPPTAAEQRAVAEERRRVTLRRVRGLNLGAAFFGWLVAVGIAVLLTAIIAAAGAALSLTQEAASTGTTTNLSISGVILLAIVLLIAYYSGGYVAGRLSRFAGFIQGIGVWVIGLVITSVLAVVGAIAGSQYNVASQLRLPSIPVNGQSFATGGAIALAAMALLTLVAAAAGGALGLRYHHRVDRLLREAP